MGEEYNLDEIYSQKKYFSVNETKREARKDLMHRVTHILAILIILFFLFMLAIQVFCFSNDQIIPDYFISIVSVVIGFYFAKSLPL
jgi:hypothetical protein